MKEIVLGLVAALALVAFAKPVLADKKPGDDKADKGSKKVKPDGKKPTKEAKNRGKSNGDDPAPKKSDSPVPPCQPDPCP